jgi:dipeptidyl aminopeptidase/acylaminoacyl peptidase
VNGEPSSRRLKPIAAAVGFAIAAGAIVSLPAQSPRAMTLVDLVEVPRVLDAQLSPDGRFALYRLARADWKSNRQISHIWQQDTAGGAPVQLTFGANDETTPRWSADGKTILFLTRRGTDADTQIYIMPVDGGEPRALTRHASSVSSPAWSPDGSAVYFLASELRTPDERTRDRVRDDVYAFEENYKQRHLWKASVATGAEQQITSGDSSVIGFRISRDGKRIALQRAPTPLAADGYRSEVWVTDADGGNARALTHNDIGESDAELSPDNSTVLFLADANANQESYYNSNLFIVPASGGPARALIPEFRYAIDGAAWAPDGRSVLAVVNMGLHSEIFRIGLDGQTRQLTDGRHSVQFWSVPVSSNQMVFQLDEPDRLGDVWTLPIEGGAPSRVTSVYDSLARDFRWPRQDKVEWKSADGTSIEGLLVYPLDYQPGHRYPLVVQLHGGPNDSDKFGAGPGFIVNYFPVLAAKGYLVLRPNYRGSSGYGNAFYRDVVGGFFKNQHLDVMAGVDALVQRGLADPDQLAVMGWSAGGHLTNKLITFTSRFKAASSTAGAANWISMYAQTDLRATRTVWFGGTPWQKDAPIAAYWDHSPLKDVAQVKTPTLFIVGEADARVPMPQSVEMYRALKSNGVPTRLYVAPREGHQMSELRHQLFKANVELEWFERHVMGRSYVWEQPPAE